MLKQTASSLDEMLHVSGRDASEHTAAAALTELRNNNNHHMKNKSIASPNAIVTSILSKNHIDHLEANSVSVIPIDAADNGKQNNGSIISGGLPNTQQQSRIKGKNRMLLLFFLFFFALHSNICARGRICVPFLKHIIATFRLIFLFYFGFCFLCEPRFNDFLFVSFPFGLSSDFLIVSDAVHNNNNWKQKLQWKNHLDR